jgi:hypothetical protein
MTDYIAHNATVTEIAILTKCDFPGDQCPQCDGPSVKLATLNEWDNWCKACDIRFNRNGQIPQ